jgi:hypothetical protein
MMKKAERQNEELGWDVWRSLPGYESQ